MSLIFIKIASPWKLSTEISTITDSDVDGSPIFLGERSMVIEHEELTIETYHTEAWYGDVSYKIVLLPDYGCMTYKIEVISMTH